MYIKNNSTGQLKVLHSTIFLKQKYFEIMLL